MAARATRQATTKLMETQHGSSNSLNRPFPPNPPRPAQPLLRMKHAPTENNGPVPVPVGCITLTPPEPCVHPTNSSRDCDLCGFKSIRQHHRHRNADHVIIGRCPHCSEKYKMRVNDLFPSTSDGEEGGIMGFESKSMDSTTALHSTFVELEETLRRHGNALQRIELHGLNATALQLPQVRSGGPTELPTPPMEKSGNLYYRTGSGTKRDTVEPATYQMMMEYSDDMDTESEHGSDDDSSHPLLYDIEDLKMLTAGVTRLLKTLHNKVSQVEKEGKAVREERKEVRKMKEENKMVAEGLEQQKMEVEKIKLHLQRQKAMLRAEQKKVRTVMMQQGQTMPFMAGIQYDSFKNQELPQIPTAPSSSNSDGKTVKRKVSFSTLAYTPIVGPGGKFLWTPEKEELLRTLQAKLRDANDNWSPEAERYYEQVEELIDERYKAKKLMRVMKTDKPGLTHKESKSSIRALAPAMRPITPVKSAPAPSAMEPMTAAAMKPGSAVPTRRRNTSLDEATSLSEEVKGLRKLFGAKKE